MKIIFDVFLTAKKELSISAVLFTYPITYPKPYPLLWIAQYVILVIQ
jgi:hypothetical protein